MKATLTKVYRTDTDKQGNALKTKEGRPYTRLSIKTNEHGEKWLSGFNSQQTASWKEGDTIEIEVEQKGEYLNFKVPKAEDKANEKLEQILNYLVGIKMQLTDLQARLPKAGHALDDDNYPVSDGEPEF